MSTPDVSSPRLVTPSAWAPQAVPRSLARGWRLGYPRLLAAIATLVLCFAIWAAFAPPQLGGSTSYAVTTGVSMLPRFHAGDLVLLRQESTYRVGEVAGYHNGQLGVVVMHRIIAIDGDHYIFRGDNNDFTDSYQPTAGQIVGAEWIHLSGWGNFLLTLRTPVIAAVLLGLMWLFVFGRRPRSRRQRRRRRHAH
ncbi:MAG: S24/S26 family peptidase [Candidatus Dormiibacterota bacterium]